MTGLHQGLALASVTAGGVAAALVSGDANTPPHGLAAGAVVAVAEPATTARPVGSAQFFTRTKSRFVAHGQQSERTAVFPLRCGPRRAFTLWHTAQTHVGSLLGAAVACSGDAAAAAPGPRAVFAPTTEVGMVMSDTLTTGATLKVKDGE